MWCLYMHLMPIMFGYDTQQQPMMFDIRPMSNLPVHIYRYHTVKQHPFPRSFYGKQQPGHSEKHFLLCSPDIQVWNDSFNSCTKLNVSEAVTCGDISDVLVMFRDVVVFCRRAAVRRVFAFLTRFPRAHGHVQCLQL